MSDDGALEANKKLVLDFMKLLVDPATSDRAADLITESYIQHNPNIASGRQAIIDWTAAFFVTRAALPRMRPGGRVINISDRTLADQNSAGIRRQATGHNAVARIVDEPATMAEETQTHRAERDGPLEIRRAALAAEFHRRPERVLSVSTSQ